MDGLSSTLHGQFQNKISLIEEELSNESKMLGGLQLAWIIIDNFAVSKVKTGLVTFRSLVKVTLKSDNLLAFQNEWKKVMLGLPRRPPDEYLEGL